MRLNESHIGESFFKKEIGSIQDSDDDSLSFKEEVQLNKAS